MIKITRSKEKHLILQIQHTKKERDNSKKRHHQTSVLRATSETREGLVRVGAKRDLNKRYLK